MENISCCGGDGKKTNDHEELTKVDRVNKKDDQSLVYI